MTKTTERDSRGAPAAKALVSVASVAVTLAGWAWLADAELSESAVAESAASRVAELEAVGPSNAPSEGSVSGPAAADPSPVPSESRPQVAATPPAPARRKIPQRPKPVTRTRSSR